MFDFVIQIFNNKLLFYGIIVVIAFTFFSIILIKKASKENNEEIDIEKIDSEPLFEEVENHAEEHKTDDGKLDLESMIEKMQQDLDAKASEVIEKFENEQEEKSIISYQELMKNESNKVDNKEYLDKILDEEKTNDETLLKQEKINSILSDANDVEDKKNTLNETYIKALKLEESNLINSTDATDELNHITVSDLNKKDEYVDAIKTGFLEKGKFKSTEFISPIYGVQDIKVQYPTVQNMGKSYNNLSLEQTLNMEPLTDEIRKNEDFLNALKEFRKNLE